MKVEKVRKTIITFTSEEVIELIKIQAELATGIVMEKANTNVVYTVAGEPHYGISKVGIDLYVEED